MLARCLSHQVSKLSLMVPGNVGTRRLCQLQDVLFQPRLFLLLEPPIANFTLAGQNSETLQGDDWMKRIQ